MRPLTRRESRLLAILLLIGAIALVTLAVIDPLVTGFRTRAARRTQLAGTFQMNERRIAAMASITHQAETEAQELRHRLITAADADDAAEALRAEVEATAAAAGVAIRSTESASGAADGDAAEGSWVHATLEAQMTHGQLAALLARLNTVRPAIVVDNVTVVAEAALNHSNADQLDVRLETSAPYIRANQG